MLAYRYIDSPVGDLLLARDEHALHYISFPTGRTTLKPRADWVQEANGFEAVQEQLDAYFAGELTEFDVPFVLTGTDFQKSVWTLLLDIPFGKTRSYGDLAKLLDKPGASRAVGAANGSNPIPIIVPCHRVIGGDNTLTGFGGGIETKRFLLEHEGVLEPEPPRLI